MHSGSRHLLFAGLSLGVISSIYFLSLTVHLPFFITVPIIFLALVLLYRWMKMPVISPTAAGKEWLPLLLLATGIFMVTKAAYLSAQKYGEWDAWAIWNLDARYLTYQGEWQKMIQNVQNAHPDYPLCLPGSLAFFFRLLGTHAQLTLSFAFAFFATLAIPTLIYLQAYKRNLIIAALIMLLFATDDFYIARGVSQYADTLLAFFFLLAFICIDSRTEHKKYIALSAASLACCMWTKNEGIVLSVIFILFYADVFFQRKNIGYFLSGIALPVLALLVFKLDFAPPNDIISAQDHNMLAMLKDKSRYIKIWESFVHNIATNFKYIKLAFYAYLVTCIFKRQLPSRQFLLLLICLLAYFMVYAVSPNDLDWHLSTSQDRVLHQLMPAMIYVIAIKFCDWLPARLRRKQAL